MRRILHVDMDAFLAAIELLQHRELAGKTLAIGGSGNPRQRGVVSTASYEARKYGIHSGMPLRTACGVLDAQGECSGLWIVEQIDFSVRQLRRSWCQWRWVGSVR